MSDLFQSRHPAESERQYRAAREMVSTSPDTLSGTPVIKGTRIPVHDIAASVAAGESVERILAAYPRLAAEQIDLAVLYARAHPLERSSSASPMLEDYRLIAEGLVPRQRRSE